MRGAVDQMSLSNIEEVQASQYRNEYQKALIGTQKYNVLFGQVSIWQERKGNVTPVMHKATPFFDHLDSGMQLSTEYNADVSYIPISVQLGFPHWWVPASSLPCLSTHQHLPVLSWHWTGSNEPSGWHLATNKPICVLLRMVIALLFSLWHGLTETLNKKCQKN